MSDLESFVDETLKLAETADHAGLKAALTGEFRLAELRGAKRALGKVRSGLVTATGEHHEDFGPTWRTDMIDAIEAEEEKIAGGGE